MSFQLYFYLICCIFIALLAFGFGGTSTVLAHASAPLRPATVSPQQADAAPSMEEYNGVFYVGWTGRNAAHNLNLMTYDPTTKSFDPAQVLTDTTLVGAGPNLVTFSGNLYGFWLGTDHRLNVGRYNLANPMVLANKVTLSKFSHEAPALAAFNGHLYLSWNGTDDRLNILSSVDGSTFVSKTTCEFAARISPSLVGANTYLLVFWEDLSARPSILVGQYDPSRMALHSRFALVLDGPATCHTGEHLLLRSLRGDAA